MPRPYWLLLGQLPDTSRTDCTCRLGALIDEAEEPLPVLEPVLDEPEVELWPLAVPVVPCVPEVVPVVLPLVSDELLLGELE